jgi:hypothetical protein
LHRTTWYGGDGFSIGVLGATAFLNHERRDRNYIDHIVISFIKTYDMTFSELLRDSDLSGYKVIIIIHYGADRSTEIIDRSNTTKCVECFDASAMHGTPSKGIRPK